MGLGASEEYRRTSGGQFYSLVTLLFAFTITESALRQLCKSFARKKVLYYFLESFGMNCNYVSEIQTS